ncbi:MAG: M20 family metallo-hydrolase [Casimicrobiaceae bacterium]
MIAAVAARVDAQRLWERHQRLARHGALANGGVNRQALSPEESAAWRELIGWGREQGLVAYTDAAGNLFLRLEGTSADLAPVLTGSHIDSQPTGGKFDGVYGVLAGLEAVHAIVASAGVPRRPIEIVAWMNEEGSRFAPGMMGSSAFTGAVPLERYRGICDAAGNSVASGLADLHAAFADVPQRALQRPLAAYVEAHIEQGPVLEREGCTIGVVTGIQGKRTFRVSIDGEASHAGTSTRRERKDALLAAVDIIHALAAAIHDAEDIVKFTVGRFDVAPNAPSVVPVSVVFSIDLRHVDSATLTKLGDRIAAICAAHAGPCGVGVVELTSAMSLEFPHTMTALIRETARELGLRAMDLPSAAGHDARFLNAVCPTGMIFVPCHNGISHNPMESATAGDLAAGARVLCGVLATLASR